jgi:acetylglutamate kinase
MKKKLYVIKIGGNIVDNPAKLDEILADFAVLPDAKILVHGGGKIATEISASLGIEAKMLDGRRITDAETLKVVTMVYAGLINKNIVARLQANACNAIGLTGADGNSILALKRPVKEVDYGFVGDVSPQGVNTSFLSALIANDISPVFAALTHDDSGQMLNTNADTIAFVLAVALSQTYDVSLVYCFEKNGVLKDINNEDSVIEHIDKRKYLQLKQEGIVAAGMIPKLDNAFSAIDNGVGEVLICHADALKGIVKSIGFMGSRLMS